MLIDILGRIIFNAVLVVCSYVIDKRKISLKDKNFYFAIIVINILSFVLMSLNLTAFKPFINITIFIFVDFYILKNKFVSSIAKIIIIYGVLLIGEFLIILLFILFGEIASSIKIDNIISATNNSPIFSAIINLIISILITILVNVKIINEFYKNFVNFFYKITRRKHLYIVLLVIIFFSLTYQVIAFSDNVLFNIVMLILLLVIILVFYSKDLSIRIEYEDTKDKYDNIQQNLLEYEEMIDKYRINNHENKNQLLIIQNMIKNKDVKVNEYIDNLVGTVYLNNERTMMDVSMIPAGGLRATIHTKLNIMENKNINYMLNVDRKLRTIDFDQITAELNLKICKIISIFIDNAIEEVQTHKKKKIVNIELYLDDENLVLEVSNKFKGELNLGKLEEKGYTTKDNGHGYGLSLAHELVESDDRLNNYKKIDDDIFTQVLEVRLKK